jgi:hypothetical protein
MDDHVHPLIGRPADQDAGLDELVARARRGEPGAAESLRAALDGAPGLWQRAGDLAALAEAAWVGLIAGEDAVLREAVGRKAAALRAEVAGPGPTPLEGLLAARVAATWLQVNHAEAVLAHAKGLPLRLAEYALKRAESAHRRHLAAVAALAAVRRLLPRTVRAEGRPGGPPGLTVVGAGDDPVRGQVKPPRGASRPAS